MLSLQCFNGLIYAITVAFGFIIFENFLYMLDDMSASMVIFRGFFGAMAHMVDAVFMGCYYGNAKYSEAVGDKAGRRNNLIKALLIPVLLHGIYDFLIDLIQQYDSDMALLLFAVFFIFEIVMAVKTMKKAFRENREIPGINDGSPVSDETDEMGRQQ